jgi:hypothetical protein
VLAIVGFFDTVAQAPFTRQLTGPPVTPPWLAGAMDSSKAMQHVMAWLPDPVTSWIQAGTSSSMVIGRLAAVPVALLCCVVAVRRLPGSNAQPSAWSLLLAAKTVVGWSGPVLSVLLILRYLHTGFASLLWALAALGWWTVLVLPLIALLVRRAGRLH